MMYLTLIATLNDLIENDEVDQFDEISEEEILKIIRDYQEENEMEGE